MSVLEPGPGQGERECPESWSSLPQSHAFHGEMQSPKETGGSITKEGKWVSGSQTAAAAPIWSKADVQGGDHLALSEPLIELLILV